MEKARMLGMEEAVVGETESGSAGEHPDKG